MSIWLIVGPSGGGKSYSAVTDWIIPALKDERAVVTNLTVNVEALAEYCKCSPALLRYVEPTEGEGQPFSKLAHLEGWNYKNEVGRGALYVIDEAQVIYPKGHFANGRNKDVFDWYTQHRKHGVDVVLITQAYMNIARELVHLVEAMWSVQKAYRLGQPNRFAKRKHYSVGRAYDEKAIIHHSKKIFALYRSYFDGASEQGAPNVGRNQLNSWVFYAAGGLLLWAAYSAATSGLLPWSSAAEPRDRVSTERVQSANQAEPIVQRQEIARPVADHATAADLERLRLAREAAEELRQAREAELQAQREAEEAERGRELEALHRMFALPMSVAGWVQVGDSVRASVTIGGHRIAVEELQARGWYVEATDYCELLLRYRGVERVVRCRIAGG